MRATRISLMFVLMFSVALAQTEVDHNFKVTNLDLGGQPLDTYQWLSNGCFLVDVENQNQLYKRDFDLSVLIHNNNAKVTSMEELKNLSHQRESCSTTCNPWDEIVANGTSTHANCTTTCTPFDSWFMDYKPAKMFLINGKSSTQKTETINIGKGETKRFRVCVDVPLNSAGKFDIGVYDINDATMTLLDPWWDANWFYRVPYVITENSGHYLTNHQVNITIDTAALIAAGKMLADCGDMRFTNSSDIEIDFWNETACNSATTRVWVEVPIVPASDTETIYLYYSNPLATSAGNGSNTFIFFDDFLGAAVDTSKWTVDDATGVSVKNSELNISNGLGTVRSTAAYSNHNIIQETRYIPRAATGGQGVAIMGFWDTTTDNVGLFGYGASATTFAYHVCNGTDAFAAFHTPYPMNNFFTIAKLVKNGTASLYYAINDTTGAVDWSNLTSASCAELDNEEIRLGKNYWEGGGDAAINQGWDWIRLRAFAAVEPTYSAGSEEVFGELNTITIHNPSDGEVFVNNTLFLNFTVTSTTRTTINITIEQNSTLFIHDDVTNATPYLIYLNVSQGTQIINVIANYTNKSVSAYTIYSNVTNTSYSTPVYETINQTFNISIDSPFTISNTQLIWNGTQYASTAQGAASWYKILQIPLVSVNNTNISVYWNYTVGTPTTYQNTSDAQTQVITLAYYFNTTSHDKSSYPEGEPMTLYSYIINHSAVASLNVYVTFNGSVYNSTFSSHAQGNLIYKTIISLPSVPNDNYTFNFSHNATIGAGGLQRDINITDSVMVRYLVVDNCTAYSQAFLKLVTYDEETNAQLSTIDYDVLITWWVNASITIRNYSTSMTNFTNATFCMSPPSSNFTINMTVSYQDQYDRYSVRSWYYVDEAMSNISKTQRIYLLNVSSSFYVAIAVSDTYGVEQPGILVEMQRFFYGDSAWRAVQVGLTDQAGATSVYLVRYDVPYRFALYNGQTLLRTYTERSISSSPLSLKTAAETVTIYNDWFGVRVGCVFTNSTKMLVCTVGDSANRVSGWRLKAYEQGIVDPDVYCDNVLISASGTLSCDVSAYNATGIFWAVYMTIDGFDYRVSTGSAIISYPTVAFGDTGALVAMMLVLMTGAIGIWNPAVGMVMVFSGVALGSWAGLFPISPPVLIALAAVVALMVYRMKA